MERVETSPVTLRGHHLVCLQFLHGGGYTVEFARNLMRLRDRMEHHGAIVAGERDDVCAACPRQTGRACSLCPDTEEHVRDLDRIALGLLNLREGDFIEPQELLKRISVILPQWREQACSRCAWAESCAAAINLLTRAN